MNIKIVIIGVLLTAILVGGGVVVMSRSPNAASLEKTDKTKFFTDHTNFDWGKINYNGGVVNHVFEIKNSGESSLKLANIKTSCMCTTAKISTKNGAGPTVKMHEVSDWQGVLEPGETAQLEVVFDPVFNIYRFADINNLSFLVFKKIHARFAGEFSQPLFYSLICAIHLEKL